ncbi:hypothetical protein ES708_32327 [subsurface metagenome]
MLTISINMKALRNVDVVEGSVVIEVEQTGEVKTRIKMTPEVWEKICNRVIEDLDKGASPGEEVE